MKLNKTSDEAELLRSSPGGSAAECRAPSDLFENLCFDNLTHLISLSSTRQLIGLFRPRECTSWLDFA
jgi:hypothetical protein